VGIVFGIGEQENFGLHQQRRDRKSQKLVRPQTRIVDKEHGGREKNG
jgi:hypothetical protein